MDNGLPPAVAAMLGSIIRWALNFFAAYMVGKGIWTNEEASSYVLYLVGAVLVGLWGVWQKRDMFKKYFTALAMGKPASHEDVKAVVTAGEAPPVTLAARQVPFLSSPSDRRPRP